MLKVIGASTWKTRMSTWVLAAAVFFAVVLFFITKSRRSDSSGNYCATAFWSPKTGISIEFWGQMESMEAVPKGVARACYRDNVKTTGWGSIEVETQEEFPDRIQAFAAGKLEGALTWAKIYDHWSNVIESDCEKDDESHEFCAWTREILAENYNNIKQEAEIKGHHSQYWYQVWLFYQQLEGIEHGLREGARRSQGRNHLEIPDGDTFFLNAASDVRDLKDYYAKFIEPAYTGARDPKVGALFMKLLTQDNSVQLLFGHSSGGSYTSMLRLQKHYIFRFHYSAKRNTGIVPGSNISFTGYPGIISSSDDFYWINGKWADFTVGGIRIENENKTVWEDVVLDDSTILGPRVMAANRLAYNGRSWCKYMTHGKAGTGNKQWLLVDTKKMEKESGTQRTEDLNDMAVDFDLIGDSGIIWVADQVPGKLHFRDITNEVIRRGYWFSNGLPYLEETLNMSITSNINHSNLQIVDELQQNLTSLVELSKLMINIGYRGDLATIDPHPFGNIDMKLFGKSTADASPEILIQSGPLYEKVPGTVVEYALLEGDATFITPKPSFSWALTTVMSQHNGQPNTFNFDFITPEWKWTE